MATKRLNATLTIGGAIAGSLKSAFGAARSGLADIGAEVRKLQREQRLLGSSIQTFGRMGRDVDGLRARYAGVTAELERQRRAHERLRAVEDARARNQQRLGELRGAIGTAAAVAAPIVGSVVQAAQFERAMLGVAKQVEGARDAGGRLTQVYFDMARQVQRLGREIPLATNDLADMVAAGARMGIARDELVAFTRTAAMMASAFELPAGELADQMGKVATLFKIPVPAIGELADVINYLDDNAISKGGDIIEVLKRIGGTAQFVKMPAQQAAALASTFLTLGSSAEVAATAANAAMRELSIAAMQPKRFQAGLAAIGLNAKGVQGAMAKDATGTILKVLDSLNRLPQEKRLTVATQLFGKEYGDDIAKLAEGVSEYRRQLELASSAEAKGSMSREFQAQRATTLAQWQLAKNLAGELAVNIGGALLPTVNGLMASFGALVGPVADFAREHGTLVSNVATGLVTFTGLRVGLLAASLAFGTLKAAVMGLVASNPIGLVAIAATTAAVLIYKNWEPIKTFFAGLWDGIRSGGQAAFDWVVGKVQWLGEAWQTFKARLGLGGAPAAPAAAAPAALPAPPPAAWARGGAAVTDNSQTTINVQQQPGQSSRQLVDEIARRLDERRAVQRRSIMFDAPAGA